MSQLGDLLRDAPRREILEDFGDGETRFRVRLRACSRSDIERMRKRALVQRRDRATRTMVDDLDLSKVREWIRDHVVLGWESLTFRKALALCNRASVNGAVEYMDEPVPFSTDHVQLLLEEAMGFEDFVFQRCTEVAEERAAEEQAEKKT